MSTETERIREIDVIVGGTPYGKKPFPDGIELKGLLAKVLAETKNTARPPEDWEAKDSAGTLLDLDKQLCDYPLLEKIFITLKAGIGG